MHGHTKRLCSARRSAEVDFHAPILRRLRLWALDTAVLVPVAQRISESLCFLLGKNRGYLACSFKRWNGSQEKSTEKTFENKVRLL